MGKAGRASGTPNGLEQHIVGSPGPNSFWDSMMFTTIVSQERFESTKESQTSWQLSSEYGKRIADQQSYMSLWIISHFTKAAFSSSSIT